MAIKELAKILMALRELALLHEAGPGRLSDAVLILAARLGASYQCPPPLLFLFRAARTNGAIRTWTKYSSASCWAWSEPGIFFFGSLERFLFFVFVGHTKKKVSVT